MCDHYAPDKAYQFDIGKWQFKPHGTRPCGDARTRNKKRANMDMEQALQEQRKKAQILITHFLSQSLDADKEPRLV